MKNVCRVCLTVDVRMHHMSHKLSAMYERVVNIKMTAADKNLNLPKQLCWECVARLRSANRFIVKALKTQRILMEKLKDCPLLQIHDNITPIDRAKNGLCSTLVSKIYNYNECCFLIIGADETKASRESFEEKDNTVDSDGLEDVTDSEIHEVKDLEIHKDTYSEIHKVNNSKIHELTDSEIHEISHPEIDEITDSEFHKVKNSKIHELTDSEIHVISDPEIDKITDSEFHKVKNSKIHELTDSEIHEISDPVIDEITDSEFEEVTDSEIHESVSNINEQISNISEQVSRSNIDKADNNVSNDIEVEIPDKSCHSFEIEVKIEEICEELPVDTMILGMNMENEKIDEDISSRRNRPLNKPKRSDMITGCKELYVVLEDINLKKNTTQVNTNDVTSMTMVLRKRNKTSLPSKKNSKCTKYAIESPKKAKPSTKASIRNNHIVRTRSAKKRNVQLKDPGLKKVFICAMCNKQFGRKTSLKQHIQRHTSLETYNCTFCSYKSDQKGNLMTHINTKHTKNEIYKCPHCPYETFQKGYIKKHVNQKHTKATSYNCPHCPYVSYNTSVLKYHINAKHTKDTVYKCPYCSYESFAKFSLKLHVDAKHVKGIAYDCIHCSYRTYNKYDLRRHINGKHTKSTVFKCSLCRFTSFYELSLFNHMKKKHP